MKMLLHKVKKKKEKDRKQLLLILYRVPWSFPENALTLSWENESEISLWVLANWMPLGDT